MRKQLSVEVGNLLDSAMDADQIAILRIERLREPLSPDSELGKSFDGIESVVMRNAEKLRELNRQLDNILEKRGGESKLADAPLMTEDKFAEMRETLQDLEECESQGRENGVRYPRAPQDSA